MISGNKLIFYVTALRALAAVLITNSHYTGVYPTDLISNGGLLGDVLFFAVSGFVLVNIRQSFPVWYKKRVIRIYPTIWIITGIYLLLGFFTFEGWSFAENFIYPTNYHFIASIIVLYIPYYFVVKIRCLSDNIPKIMAGLFVLELIVYILFYNKSYYHIDTVREPMIRFLFLQSMLLGLYFRKNTEKIINRNKIINWIILFAGLGLYFASKLAFVKTGSISSFQIINQIILFFTLFYIIKCFAGIDGILVNLPSKVKKTINFISEITLEIYLVQIVIIPRLAYISFPLNWIIITGIIIISAYLLHIIGSKISKVLDDLTNKLFMIKSGEGA